MSRLVLASSSPRRLELLRQLGLDPVVRSAEVDERYLPGETPREHVERLAAAKAEAVAAAEPEGLVVGGDTVVVAGERVLGKPASDEEAVAMLRTLAGTVHHVWSGVALVARGRTRVGSTCTEVRFRAFDEATARAYVATGEPLDKAGAYGIQGLGAALVEEIRGDYYTVVGFPVARFLELLAEAGRRYDFRGIVAPDPNLEPREP